MRRTIFRPSSLGLRHVRPVRLGVLTLMFAASAGLAAGAPPRAHADAPSYTVTDLGTFPGRSYGFAKDINASGQVVGDFSTGASSNDTHAFRTTATGRIDAASDLGTLPGGSYSYAAGISASGQVVGVGDFGTSGGGDMHAFRTTATGRIDATSDLGTLPGDQSSASGINASGQVVGGSYYSYIDGDHAFRTTATGRIDAASDLGTLPGGSYSEAIGINASGQVVGYSNFGTSGGDQHAFRTTATGRIDAASDLGTLPGDSSSEAIGINASGQVVGYSGTSGVPYAHAFLYDDSATPHMRNLNSLIPSDSGVTLTEAQGINDLGQIAATGTINGQTHAFRLTPNSAYPAQLQLTGIEVTQGIQDLNNSIALIANRATYVRAYVRATSRTMDNVYATLSGTRNGIPLPDSPLTALNYSGAGDITVYSNPDRGQINDSFFFQLPPAWLNGSVDLRFHLTNLSVTCVDTSGNCETKVSFTPSPRYRIRFLPIAWTDSNNQSVHVPAVGDIGTALQQIEQLFPLAPDAISAERVEAIEPNLSNDQPTTTAQFARLLAILGDLRLNSGCITSLGCTRVDEGLLVDPPVGTTGLTFGTDVSASYLMGDTGLSRVRGYSHVHELGHAAGRSHTPCPGTNPSYPGTFPNPNGQISPVLTGNKAIYGFSNIDQHVYGPSSPDLMSYCDADQWISDYTYKGIKDGLIGRFGTAAPVASRAQALMTTDNVAGVGKDIVVGGIITPTEGVGEILPLYTIMSSASSPISASGAYAIQLQGSDGHTLATYPFDPDMATTHSGPAVGIFSLLLPLVDGTSRIVLTHQSQTLATISAPPHAPTVTLTFPNGGETLTGPTATVSWTASDPDGRTLRYAVQYSTDAGATWDTLANDLITTSYQLDLTSIAGTDHGLIRVLATDGFHTAQAQSAATFSVPYQAPQVTIQSPTDNEAFVNDPAVTGNKEITLRGTAFDNQDGLLNGDALNWTVDGGTSLGTGQAVGFNISNLSAGTHLITLAARDSKGLLGHASTTISVLLSRPVLPPQLSIGSHDLTFSTSQGSGVDQPVTQSISIRNNGDGVLHWAAHADQPWITLSSINGLAPSDVTVSIDPSALAGFAAGQYSGTIAFTSPDADSTISSHVTVVVEPHNPPPPPTSTPESPSAVLLSLGLIGLFAFRRVRHRGRRA